MQLRLSCYPPPPSSIALISLPTYMTDWEEPTVILSEYCESFIRAKVLSSEAYLHASDGYVKIVYFLFGLYMWAYLLTYACNFLILLHILYEQAGRSSWASISTTPSSPGNGIFVHHFLYASISTRLGIEQPNEVGTASFTWVRGGSLWSPSHLRWWDKTTITTWIVRYGFQFLLCSIEWG